MSLLDTALKAGAVAAAAGVLARAWVRRSRHFAFRDRTVAITGGSRGLGLVLARQLVDRGARVAICARSEEELRAAEVELRARGGDVLTRVCDVRDAAQVEDFVRATVERFGTVDVLMHVAGVIQVGPLDAMTDADFREAMETHCWGALHAVRAVLPVMRERGWGRIVTVASLGGKRAVPHMLPYAASKFALVGLSQGLRSELAKENILVTTVCPSLMRTGSPRNAVFKGQHRKEHAWFRIADSLPLMSVSAETAARRILSACQRGKVETVPTVAGKVGALLQGVAPGLVTEALSLGARLLPDMGGIGTHSAPGYESESPLAPSWLTRLGDRAALRNNEVRTDTPETAPDTAGA